MTVFKKKGSSAPGQTQLGKMVALLQEQVGNSHMVTANVAKSAFALESISDSDLHALNGVSGALETALESIVVELGIGKLGTQAQMAAATAAGVMAGDFKGFLARKQEPLGVSTESMTVVTSNVADGMSERSFALEAYDERENRNAVIYSIAYNYQAARQDEFGETFFPTITLTPENVGFGITVNLMMVYDGAERKISGSFEDFKKKNIIRAVADHTVLKKEQTRITPVHRAQSADKFAAGIAPYAVLIEGESITTAPLAFGKKLDLLGLSQTDTLLATGIQDQTDTLDPTINLQSVYADFGGDVLKFNVANLPTSNFTFAQQGNYRLQALAFTTSSVLINKNTKRMDGSALTDLAAAVTNDWIVRLEMHVTGNSNIETGETSVYGNRLSVASIQDATGQFLDLTAGAAAAFVTAIEAGVLVGYDLQAYRTNVNRRQRGQLIDVTRQTQLYNVPLRSPITTMHPATVDGQTDASDVQALVTATRIRTSNEAVSSLLSTATLLSDYVDARDVTGVGPDVLGVGRHFVRPAFRYLKLDIDTSIDSVKSHERAADIQAVLVNQLRDMAYNLYRDSEYKAAADALAGGIAPVPEVIIGTDPITARYINVTGDLRTLGGEFNVRIVSTLDIRMQGKIIMVFGVMDESRNTQPNPLNFGNMIWAPELVLTANLSRGNTYSRETVVQPKYTFCVHCPIMGVMEIDGIADALNKVPLHFKNVP